MTETTAPAWYDAPKNEAHGEVAGAILELILKTDVQRRNELFAWRCIYLDLPDGTDGTYDRLGYSRYGKMENNVLQGDVDTTVAQLITSRPKPKMHTRGGDWAVRQKTKLLNRWSDGEWERLGLHKMQDRQVMEGAIFGTGCIKISARFGRPYAERVWAGHLWVDPREEFHDCVRSLYQYAGKDRDELARQFPGHKDAILTAPGIRPEDASNLEFIADTASINADLVAVVEAWRLPTDDGTGEMTGGRHVICIDGADLLDEEWKHEMFPFSFFRWAEDPFRFWGQGMVERGVGPQMELNDLTHTSRQSYERWFPAWFMPQGGTIAAKMSDEVGRVYWYDPATGRPEYYVPTAAGGEIVQREMQLEGRVHARMGVSQMDSAGDEPTNYTSGKALLVRKDTRSIRFGPQGTRYEDACVDLQKILMFTADDIAESDGDHKLTVYQGDEVLEEIKFGEARMKGIEYQVRCEAISKLADDLSGKLEQLSLMRQEGLLTDATQMWRLMDMPDLEAAGDSAHAQRDRVDKAIGNCLDGEAVPCDAFMDTPYAVSKGIEQLNEAEVLGAPEEDLAHLRNFISHAMEIESKKQAALAPPPAPMAGPANDAGAAMAPPPAE